MEEAVRTASGEDDWFTVRGFSEGRDGSPLPKYEAKFVRDEGEFADDELVLVKEVHPGGRERVHHIPMEVLADISRPLPG